MDRNGRVFSLDQQNIPKHPEIQGVAPTSMVFLQRNRPTKNNSLGQRANSWTKPYISPLLAGNGTNHGVTVHIQLSVTGGALLLTHHFQTKLISKIASSATSKCRSLRNYTVCKAKEDFSSLPSHSSKLSNFVNNHLIKENLQENISNRNY